MSRLRFVLALGVVAGFYAATVTVLVIPQDGRWLLAAGAWGAISAGGYLTFDRHASKVLAGVLLVVGFGVIWYLTQQTPGLVDALLKARWETRLHG
jgi:hypothetical protein